MSKNFNLILFKKNTFSVIEEIHYYSGVRDAKAALQDCVLKVVY